MKLTVFSKEKEDSLIDFLRIDMYLPGVYVFQRESYSGTIYSVGLTADTQISYNKETSIGWNIYLMLLGFGFSVHRQYGY